MNAPLRPLLPKGTLLEITDKAVILPVGQIIVIIGDADPLYKCREGRRESDSGIVHYVPPSSFRDGSVRVVA